MYRVVLIKSIINLSNTKKQALISIKACFFVFNFEKECSSADKIVPLMF